MRSPVDLATFTRAMRGHALGPLSTSPPVSPVGSGRRPHLWRRRIARRSRLAGLSTSTSTSTSTVPVPIPPSPRRPNLRRRRRTPPRRRPNLRRRRRPPPRRRPNLRRRTAPPPLAVGGPAANGIAPSVHRRRSRRTLPAPRAAAAPAAAAPAAVTTIATVARGRRTLPRRGGVHAGSTRASARRRRVRPRAGADARRRRVRSRVRVRRRRIRPRRREIGRGIGRRLRGGFRPRGWFRRPPVHARLTAKVQRRPRRLRRRRREVGGARGRGGFLFVVRYPVIVYVIARLVGFLVSRGGGGGCCGFAARVRVEERVASAEDGRVESAAPAPSAEDGAHAADVVGGTL